MSDNKSKFKVGDRVRVVPGSGTCLLFENREYTVEAVDGDDVSVHRIDRDGTGYGIAPYESERFINAATPHPIRTVTRREIVPGVYMDGAVEVFADGAVVVEYGFTDANQLREAAHLFNQLAEVLEENAASGKAAA